MTIPYHKLKLIFGCTQIKIDHKSKKPYNHIKGDFVRKQMGIYT